MGNHKKLKEICDKIKFSKFNNYWDGTEFSEGGPYGKVINVREIIFTQEFQNKCADYWFYSGKSENMQIHPWIELGKHLDDPAGYLHNLLFKND